MVNPSNIWADLATPNPSIGSLPFVDIDGATITTDVLNFFYQSSTASIPVVANVKLAAILANQLTVLNGLRSKYVDKTAVAGAATINAIAGRIKIAAGQTSAVVTNNCAFATSIISVQIEGAFDATATAVRVSVQADGSFTVTLNAAATAAVVVSFYIHNVYA